MFAGLLPLITAMNWCCSSANRRAGRANGEKSPLNKYNVARKGVAMAAQATSGTLRITMSVTCTARTKRRS
jgi:hypothetical protein